MSSAPFTASASTRNPLTEWPSASRSDPIRAARGSSRQRRRRPRGRATRFRPDRGARAVGDAQQPGLGRSGAGQREQAVVRRRLHLAREGRAELDEFAVERQAGEMRADDGDLDAAAAARTAGAGGGMRPVAPIGAPERAWIAAASAGDAARRRRRARSASRSTAARRRACPRERRWRRDRAG